VIRRLQTATKNYDYFQQWCYLRTCWDDALVGYPNSTCASHFQCLWRFVSPRDSSFYPLPAEKEEEEEVEEEK